MYDGLGKGRLEARSYLSFPGKQSGPNVVIVGCKGGNSRERFRRVCGGRWRWELKERLE